MTTIETLTELRTFFAGRVERNRYSYEHYFELVCQAQRRGRSLDAYDLAEYLRSCKDTCAIQRFVDALDVAIETIERVEDQALDWRFENF